MDLRKCIRLLGEEEFESSSLDGNTRLSVLITAAVFEELHFCRQPITAAARFSARRIPLALALQSF